MFKKYVSRKGFLPRELALIPAGAYLVPLFRFNPSADIAGQTPLKSSAQRSIRSAVLSQWKIEPETLESIWGKKDSLVHVRWSVPGGTASVISWRSLSDIRSTMRAAVITSPCTLPMANRSSFNILMVPFYPPCGSFTNASKRVLCVLNAHLI
jgi:hypothetical protein